MLNRNDEKNKSDYLIVRVNYYLSICCPGHVNVDIVDRNIEDSIPHFFDFGGGGLITFETPSFSVPLFVQNKKISDIDNAYKNSFLAFKPCCCCYLTPCYCYFTKNCADSAKDVLKQSGFDINTMPFCSWTICIRSSVCKTPDLCCCCVPSCGCSNPADVFYFALKESASQMASSPFIYDILKNEYTRSMQKYGWSEQCIAARMKEIEGNVEKQRKKINERTYLFKPSQEPKQITKEMLAQPTMKR